MSRSAHVNPPAVFVSHLKAQRVSVKGARDFEIVDHLLDMGQADDIERRIEPTFGLSSRSMSRRFSERAITHLSNADCPNIVVELEDVVSRDFGSGARCGGAMAQAC